MGITDEKDFNVSVTTLYLHGEHYFLATITREPFEVVPLEEDTEFYQWVDSHFERYGDEPPLPLNPCPGYPHDHDGVRAIAHLGTWLRRKTPLDRHFCNCSGFFETPWYDHSDPPLCRAFSLAAAILEGLMSGKRMEEIILDPYLFQLPSTAKNRSNVFHTEKDPMLVHRPKPSTFKRTSSNWKF